jgi:hypothetical protein
LLACDRPHPPMPLRARSGEVQCQDGPGHDGMECLFLEGMEWASPAVIGNELR